jgi:Arc/MetJ family transcription regulator
MAYLREECGAAVLELHQKRPIRCIRSWRVLVGRTNIVLDDDLIRQAMQVTGAKTKRQAVDRALRELVARGSVYRALRKLKGKMPWDGDVDAWRRGRR